MNHADLTAILASDGKNRSKVVRLIGAVIGWSGSVAVNDDDRANARFPVVVGLSASEVMLEIIVANSKEFFAPDNTHAGELEGVSKLAGTAQAITVLPTSPTSIRVWT
jgi:hypothetical protein